MNAASIEWWPELFPPVEAGSEHWLRMRVLRKQGRPFLVLPDSAPHAAFGLKLYPAQRWQARWSVKLLRAMFQARLPVCSRVSLCLDKNDPLLRFMEDKAGGTSPQFAVLAGNPAAAGRRFIVMFWLVGTSTPVILKVGLNSGVARELIAQEENFLRQLPAAIPGVPRVMDSFRSERLCGFTLPFVPGEPPATLTPTVVQLLQGWLMPDRLIPARAVATWQKLAAACANVTGWSAVADRMEATPFATTVMHGDFVPWNVRLQGTERAQVLDWERGEFPGVPAWDWFHFELQSAILVRRERGGALVQRCENFLRAENFRAYAAAAGLAGRERECLLAYLFHVVHRLKPTEGYDANRELLQALLQSR